MITNQLNHERVGLAALGGRTEQLFEDTLAWARRTPATPRSSTTMIEVPWVQLDLARCHARLEAMRLLNWKMAVAAAAEELSPADSSAVKVYGTETHVEVYRLLLGVVGSAGYLREGSSGAVLHGQLERAARAAQINTFGGGVNDVQRDIVAAAGLKMARQPR
jgi:alkylation response protein AidB-like acyl-CoA dehydrogenase